MTDDKKPAVPRLIGIRFEDAQTLSGVTPLKAINLTEPQFAQYRVAVVGASVFIQANGGRLLEVPRSKVTLTWDVEDVPFDDAVRAASGGKR